MFLRNYDNYFVAINLCPQSTNTKTPALGNSSSVSPTSGYEDGTYVQRSTNGTNNAVAFAYYYDYSALSLPPILFVPHSICLGDGTTAVTYDDYQLSGNVIENKLVKISSNKTYNFQTHKWKMTMVASYSNTGDADITISEWGLWRNNSSYSTTAFSNSSSTCCLVFREVLDEPIVIAAGTTATLSFSIEIPMPNHP